MSQSGTPTANIHPHDEEAPIHASGAASIVKLAQKGLRHSLHRGSEDVAHDIKTFQSIYVPSNFPAKPKKREDQTPFSSFVQQQIEGHASNLKLPAVSSSITRRAKFESVSNTPSELLTTDDRYRSSKHEGDALRQSGLEILRSSFHGIERGSITKPNGKKATVVKL